MYRILRAAGQTGERRAQATHPARTKPELVADAPNQVWSWDITRLRGPVKGIWFHLYTVIDIWSRYVVGHLVAAAEDGQLAEALIADAAARERVDPDQLIVHADRGAAMTCKTVTQLLSDLKIGRSHSRPKTSNDNPFIEAGFKTLKYDPTFPERFGSIQHARQHCEAFYSYYNHEHRHSGIGLHTPASVHHGTAEQIREQRQRTLDTARALAQKEGIFVGISAGGTFGAALEVAKKAKKGDVILAMLPDTGERYLSTILFEGILEGSDDEWLAQLEAGKS